MIAAFFLALGVMIVWSGATLMSFVCTRGKDTTILMSVTLGVLMLKFLLISAVLWLLKPYDFYNHMAFILMVIILAVLATVFEAWYIYRRINSPITK